MSKRRKRSIFGDGGRRKSAVECFVPHPIMEGSNGDKERLKGQVAEYFNFEYFNSANKKYEINIVTPIVLQQCWSLYCEQSCHLRPAAQAASAEPMELESPSVWFNFWLNSLF